MTQQERVEKTNELIMVMSKSLECADGVAKSLVVAAIFSLLVRAITNDVEPDEARQACQHFGHTLLALSAEDGEVN